MNRCVLRCFLKVSVTGIWRTERGRLFQVVGPATEKEREPVIVCFVLGMRNKCVSDEERRERDGVYRWSWSLRYCGADL